MLELAISLVQHHIRKICLGGDVSTQLIEAAVGFTKPVTSFNSVDTSGEVTAWRAHPVVGDLDGELVFWRVIADLDELVLVVGVAQILSLVPIDSVAPLDLDGQQRCVGIAADVGVEASRALVGNDVVGPGLSSEVEWVARERRSISILIRLTVDCVVLVIPGLRIVLKDTGNLDLNEAVTDVGIVLERLEGRDEVRRVGVSAWVEVDTGGCLNLTHKIISPLRIDGAPPPAVAVRALGVTHEQDLELVALLVHHDEGVDDRERVSHGDTTVVVRDDLS